MNRKFLALAIGSGCLIILGVVVSAVVLLILPFFRIEQNRVITVAQPAVTAEIEAQRNIPTLEAAPAQPEANLPLAGVEDPVSLEALYEERNSGVVNIQVYVERNQQSGQGAGSGFVLDRNGHIVTNNHVVASASHIVVVFYNGIEAEAEIIGTDDDSDLAIIQVDALPDGANPLPLGDSDQVNVGEWVVAIGNPFSLGGSMTLGIVSAVGRSIPSGATPFVIPQAIQTDAAVNPGNSGGPLLNLQGEVIGVNAQIRTGSPANLSNSGVGFAIPINVVRRITPVLIEHGRYEWPWLGVQGGDVTLLVMQANNLDTQRGAYIDGVVPNSPAAEAGLQGTSGVQNVNGLEIPVGGDVVIAADGQQIADFGDLLLDIALRNPGDTMELTILRNGEQEQIHINLAPRPAEFGP